MYRNIINRYIMYKYIINRYIMYKYIINWYILNRNIINRYIMYKYIIYWYLLNRNIINRYWHKPQWSAKPSLQTQLDLSYVWILQNRQPWRLLSGPWEEFGEHGHDVAIRHHYIAQPLLVGRTLRDAPRCHHTPRSLVSDAVLYVTHQSQRLEGEHPRTRRHGRRPC